MPAFEPCARFSPTQPPERCIDVGVRPGHARHLLLAGHRRAPSIRVDKVRRARKMRDRTEDSVVPEHGGDLGCRQLLHGGEDQGFALLARSVSINARMRR